MGLLDTGEQVIQVKKTKPKRNDGKQEKVGTETDEKVKGRRAKGGTNQQRKQEKKKWEWRRDSVRQNEICGHLGDDRYCSRVGVDPFIALPTKADNGTKTQGTKRGLYGPICVYVFV